MKTRFVGLFFASLLLLSGVGNASALPVSNCTEAPRTCDLYESDADGNPTERPPALTLPFDPRHGYLVINEKGTELSSQQDARTWSDVVLFTENMVQLFSDPFIFKGQQGENVPFTRIDVIHGELNGNALGRATVYLNEDTDPTSYYPDVEAVFNPRPGGPGDPHDGQQFTYRIHSDNQDRGADAPEPGTLLLLGSGLLGFAGAAWRRRRRP